MTRWLVKEAYLILKPIRMMMTLIIEPNYIVLRSILYSHFNWAIQFFLGSLKHPFVGLVAGTALRIKEKDNL